MPTPWKRSPEELHKTYAGNTEAFYKSAGRVLTRDVDEFVRECATTLWSRSGAVTEAHVEAINSLYSKGMPRPRWLLWELTGAVVGGEPNFLPPMFFWPLAETDAKRGTETSRLFIRLLVNVLLYLAAVSGDISFAEAEYIDTWAKNLSAICESAGVKRSKPPLSAYDYVTSGETPLCEKYADSHETKNDNAGTGTSAATESDTETKPGDASRKAEQPKPDAETLMAELESLVGLTAVKNEVRSLVNLMKVRKLREQNSLPIPPMSLHLVFTGNPGTGKTTVARLLAGLYASIGVLSKGGLVEVDRSGLVAGYVGQTAIKTAEVIESAMGRVLFIDEAYSLSSGGDNDFGREAIESLLKAMEDKRTDLVVIVAGYDKPMEKFLNSNPGLESRFNKYVRFEDYTSAELLSIFEGLCAKHSYTLSDDAREYAGEFFEQMYQNRDENFANGREVRNVFETMVSRNADRIAAMEDPSVEDLVTVLRVDLGGAAESAHKQSPPNPEHDDCTELQA